MKDFSKVDKVELFMIAAVSVILTIGSIMVIKENKRTSKQIAEIEETLNKH